VPDLIADNVARAYTLPSRFYTASDVAEEERKKIFGSTWQIAGRSDQVASPGDYFTTELAGEPLLLARANDGRLRGFYNVCRHRAGPPATGCGTRKVFRCGYHGWTYSLEGKLLNAPECEGVEGFRGEDFGLAPIRTEEWSGLVFVQLSGGGPELLPALRELPVQAAKFGFPQMRFYKRREYVMECNWKTYIDNFLEGYHLPSVHPSLNRELDYSNYTTELFERHSRQSSPIRDAANEKDAERRYAQSRGDLAAEYYWVFPNWMLNCYPDNVSVNIVLPLGAERCVAWFDWYFPEEVLATEAPEKTVAFSHEIQLEDGGICEVVQRNLRSASYDRGRYSVKQERCLHHFHRLYAERMG
jgi:choline monooxygenase